MQADGDERVLERGASALVSVNVPGRNAPQPEPPRELGQPPVPCAVVAQERSLELDAQPILSERISQPRQRRLVMNPPQRASTQTHETFRIRKHELQWNIGSGWWRAWTPLARVRVRARKDPA